MVESKVGKEKYLFVEALPNEWCPSFPENLLEKQQLLYAPHWYDLNALFNKTFSFMTVDVQGLSRVGPGRVLLLSQSSQEH
jgi:hypothetical protein